MTSEKRPVGLSPASRRPSSSGLWGRLLSTVALVTAVAGCSVIHPAWGPARNRHSASAKRSAHHKAPQEKKSLLASWLEPEEPPPPQSMKEWMDLEPIRP